MGANLSMKACILMGVAAAIAWYAAGPIGLGVLALFVLLRSA